MPETIKPSEQFTQTPVPVEIPTGVLTDDGVALVIKNRADSLASLREHISRKLYYTIEEKIKREVYEFTDLLDKAYGRKKSQEKYTNILDSNYFEQIFM